jgi:hypothetical protein
MKIIAESRPVAVVPFVHLGYVAAGYSVPHVGLLMSSVFLVAGLAMVCKLVKWRGGQKQRTVEVGFRKSRIGAIGVVCLLVGALLVFGARTDGGPDHAGSGFMLFVAGLGMVCRLVRREVIVEKERVDVRFRKSKIAAVGVLCLLVSAWLVVSAWVNWG